MIKKLILVLTVLLTVQPFLYSQTNDAELEFTVLKNMGNQKVVYFNINGIEKSGVQNEKIVERLLMDPSIHKGRIYKTPNMEDRCQLYIDLDIDAEYILSILKEFDLDYNYTIVSKNGHLDNNQEKKPKKIVNPKTPVPIEGFPEYNDTGNPEKDRADYAKRKKEWINQNPEKHQKYLDDLKNQ